MKYSKSAIPALIGGLLAVMVAQGIARFGYTPLLPLMQDAEGFGVDVGGYLASVNYWGYFLGSLFAAYIATSNNKLFWFYGALVIILVTTPMMGSVDDFMAWSIIRFFSGLAGGMTIALGAALTQESVRHSNIKNWAGIYFSGVGLGIALTGSITWFLSDRLSWEEQWYLLGLISLVLVIPAFIWIRPAKAVNENIGGGNRHWSLPVWLLISAYFLDGLGYVVSTTFLVSIITQLPNLESWGNQTWILVGAAAAPSCLLWPLLVPRFGQFKLVIGIYFLQSLAIVSPILIDGVAGALIGGLLFGATFLSAISLSFNLAALLVPTNTGRLLGVLTAVFGAGQLIGPAISGWLAERTGTFDLALIMSASAIALAGCLLVAANVIYERRTQLRVNVAGNI
ncbi:MAG: YbfB/YjiJ family MFS transporter [Sneathiella sp.]